MKVRRAKSASCSINSAAGRYGKARRPLDEAAKSVRRFADELAEQLRTRNFRGLLEFEYLDEGQGGFEVRTTLEPG